MNKDFVTESGESLVASPWFGVAGSVGTVVIFTVNYMYSRNAISEIYETEDGQRLGFCMHNMYGGPGRRFEVPLGNARFSDVSSTTFAKDTISLKIDGVPNNCIMDKDGEFFDSERLRFLLVPHKVNPSDSKEHRKAWRRAAAGARRRNNN